MSKRYGLPTYPIHDGMILGRRGEEEIKWLLEYGVIQSDIYYYYKIVKQNGFYCLFKHKENDNSEQPIHSASSLQDLLLECDIGEDYLAMCYWYGQYEKVDDEHDGNKSPNSMQIRRISDYVE